jgi:hypothetical protein
VSSDYAISVASEKIAHAIEKVGRDLNLTLIDFMRAYRDRTELLKEKK